MASFNNRHWPSMFRSKHAAQPWQAQPNMSSSPPSLLSGSTPATAFSLKHLSSGGEERSPDPKPRWNPRPEQIQILEAIFNSGMINPPREEIPRIRMRLQEYGQVGDANVFYWFQNRKARSKNKLRSAGGGGRAAPPRAPLARQAQAAAAPPVTPQPRTQQVPQLLASPAQAPTSSSSSSSDRSCGSSKPAAVQGMPAAAVMDLLGPLAAACPQMYYHEHPVPPAPPAPAPKAQELVAAEDPIFVPLHHQGYCLSAAEVAAILGAQYMHVPAVQQQAPALPAGAFLGLCNEVVGPTITGHMSCGGWGAGLGQCWPAGAGGAHQQLGKNTAASNTVVAREVTPPTHEGATKLGLLQYGVGVSTAVDVAATLPVAASPDAAVTVASVAASTAGLTRLAPSTTAPNGVVANYDPLQGLADGAVGVVTASAARDAAAAVAVGEPTGAEAAGARGFAVLYIIANSTGKSVVHNDVVAATKFDVRATFGDGAVLLRYAGERTEHVPVDAWGCTVEPLQHGAVYYVLL